MRARTRLVSRDKRKTVLRLLLVLLIAALVLGGIGALIYLLTQRADPTAIAEPTLIAADMGRVNTGSGLLYRSEGGMGYYDYADADKNYEVSVTSGETQLCGSGDTHVIYNAAAVQVVGAEKPLPVAETILDVACGSGHVAVLRADPATGEESVLLFNTAGEQKDQLAFASQYILRFGFYTDKNEYFYVQTLDTRTGTPLTSIYRYNMTQGSTAGLLQVQNQLVEQVCFTSSSIFLVGTNQIIRYTLENNREAYRETVYGWKLLDTTGGTFLLAPRSSEQLGILKLLKCEQADYSGATELILQAPVGTLGAFVLGERLCMVTADTVYYYDLSGKLLSQSRLERAISAVEKLSDSLLLLTSGESLSLLRIR